MADPYNNKNCQVKGTHTPQSLDMETEVLYWKCKSCPKNILPRGTTRSTQSVPSFSTPKKWGENETLSKWSIAILPPKEVQLIFLSNFWKKGLHSSQGEPPPRSVHGGTREVYWARNRGELGMTGSGRCLLEFIGVVPLSMISLLIFKRCIAIKDCIAHHCVQKKKTMAYDTVRNYHTQKVSYRIKI